MMDDKGSTLICIWGLPPFAHQNDASRAIFTAFNLINALKKIKGTYCNMGIGSGECFSGIVGGTGSRKEFSVIGDNVNLAARIMGELKSGKNQVACDLNTRMLAAHDFSFNYMGHKELKGKSLSMPFFRPRDPQLIRDKHRDKVLEPEYFLWKHDNPLILQRETELVAPTGSTIGFEGIIQEEKFKLQEYFTNEQESSKPYITMVMGEVGSGKTSYMRHLISELKSVQPFEQYYESNKNRLPIFCASINAESALHFMNAWRSIFQMLIKFYTKKNQLNKHHFIGKFIINEDACEIADLITEICGVDYMSMKKKQ